MKKISVLLMVFNHIERRFDAYKEMELPSVPTKGDKVALNDDNGIGQMYQVYDVHYGETGIDVNIINLGTVTEYYSSGYPDIVPPTGQKQALWSA